MMDIEALDYSYSILAAAAFYHFSSLEVVHKVTGESWSRSCSVLFWSRSSSLTCLCPAGLAWDSVAPCVRWMSPYMAALRSEATPLLKDFPKVKADDRHNIQTHVAYLDLLVSRDSLTDSLSHSLIH